MEDSLPPLYLRFHAPHTTQVRVYTCAVYVGGCECICFMCVCVYMYVWVCVGVCVQKKLWDSYLNE